MRHVADVQEHGGLVVTLIVIDGNSPHVGAKA